MPIYAYKCENCGHQKDVLQKMSDPILTICPECGNPTLKKQVTAAGFQLKGSGWYVTDFRDQKSTAANKKDEANSTTSDAPASPADNTATPPAATPAADSTSSTPSSTAPAPAAASPSPPASTPASTK